MRKEYKFALPVTGGLLLGVLSGAFVFFTVVGTVVGLVWGYSDHMLVSPKKYSHASQKARSPRKAAKSKRKKK